MSDKQRYILYPPEWKQGVSSPLGVIRMDTETGKTWVLIGAMHMPPDGHSYKWQPVEVVEDTTPKAPPNVIEIDVSGDR